MDKDSPDDPIRSVRKHFISQYGRHHPGEIDRESDTPPSSPADTGEKVNLQDGPPRISLPKISGKLVPNKPKKGDPIDDWFAYYYQCRLKGFNYSQKDLAKDTELKQEYIRFLYHQYRKEHGLE